MCQTCFCYDTSLMYLILLYSTIVILLRLHAVINILQSIVSSLLKSNNCFAHFGQKTIVHLIYLTTFNNN